MSEVQFSFDALSFLQEVLPEPEEATPTESIISRPTEPKPVEAKDENQTMLQDFARLQADQYDLKSMKKAPPVKSNLIQDYLDNLDMFYKDEQMNEAINSALMEATRPPIGQMSDTARTAMFSGADMRGSELTMMNNAREAQDVVQPMVTPVSRGRQPEMADSPAPVDAPSIDARSNEMLDKPKGIMNRPEVATAREDAIARSPEETVAPQIVFLNDSTTNKGSTERGIYQYAYEQGIKGDELQSFMSQVAHESSKFGKMQESGYLWKNVASMEQAKKDRLARDGVTKENATAERIFNSIYAGKNGNGDFASGDGSRYKGRGYIQLTGRDNYRLIGEDIGEDLEGNPDLMLDPEIAKRASVAWWKRNVRSKKPDYTDVKRVTRIVNGGENGLSERKKYFKRYGEKPTAPQASLRPLARPEPNIQVASN